MGGTAGRVFGRRRELEAALRLLDDTGIRAIELVGEAGIGKTAILDEVTDHARGRGWRVLTAAPSASEVQLTFAALGDLIGSLDEPTLADLAPPQRRALEVDPSDDVLVRRVTDPNAECLRDATTTIQDLSFSPDGSHLVELHGSSGAGIWTYPAVANATPTQLIAITGDWIFYSARYIGPNEIGFTAGEDANHDGTPDHIDLYEIPTTCTPQTCAIATGQGVTNLTRSGDLTYDYILNTGNFAYTSSTTPLVAVPAAGGPSGSGGNGGSAGGGTSPGGHGGKGTNGAPGATIAIARTQRLAVLTKKGLTFTFSCAAACRAKATLILAGKPKGVVLATVTRRLNQSGQAQGHDSPLAEGPLKAPRRAVGEADAQAGGQRPDRGEPHAHQDDRGPALTPRADRGPAL